MKLVRAMPKVLGATAALVFGPLLGIVVAFVAAEFSLPLDPNFLSNGGHAAPGDGFLIILYVFISFAISVPLSLLAAGVILFRKNGDTGRSGLECRDNVNWAA
jgi:hypothetical protein